MSEGFGTASGESDDLDPALMRADPDGGSYEVGVWPLTEFDLVIEQLFMGTLADEDKYALEFECPGCGHRGTVRSSHPVLIEWDPVIDGRYIAYAICATTDIIPAFWLSVDREVEGWWQGGSMPPESHLGEVMERVHECSGGGESNDRAALSPNPPPRTSSIERDLDD